jgi:hypothetical protein
MSNQNTTADQQGDHRHDLPSDPEDEDEGGRAGSSYTYDRIHAEYIPRELRRMARALDLDESVIDLALTVEEQAANDDQEREATFRSTDGRAAACLFVALRLQGAGVPISQVVEVSRVEKRTIQNAYRELVRRLGLEVQPARTGPFLERFMDELGVPDESRERARRLLDDAKDAGLTRSNPSASKRTPVPQTLAGCLVYIVGRMDDLGISQAAIGRETGVAAPTIQKHWLRLARELQVDVEPRTFEASPGDGSAGEGRFGTVDDVFDELREHDRIGPALTTDLEAAARRTILDSELLIGEKRVAGVVAGAIWHVLRERPRSERPIEQRDLVAALPVSTPTVRKRADEFAEALHGSD